MLNWIEHKKSFITSGPIFCLRIILASRIVPLFCVFYHIPDFPCFELLCIHLWLYAYWTYAFTFSARHRRTKRGGGGSPPPVIWEGGGGKIPFGPPIIHPPLPSISMWNRKKSQMYQVEGKNHNKCYFNLILRCWQNYSSQFYPWICYIRF